MNQTKLTRQFPDNLPVLYECWRKLLIDAGYVCRAEATYRRQRIFLPDQNSSEFWDQKFQESEQSHPMEDWRISSVIDQIPPKATVLNIGAGRGKLEGKLFATKEVKYVGTDITRDTLRELKKKFPAQQFLESTVTHLPFPDAAFERVLLLEVLEHIKPNQTFSVLAEAKRVLKENGTFILSVPVHEGLEKMLPLNPNSHMRFYSESLIIFELRRAGFKPYKLFRASAFASLFPLKHLINKLFPMRLPNNLLVLCRKN